MCFPFLFRGALDVRASDFNDEMKLACALRLATLARERVPNEVKRAYDGAVMAKYSFLRGYPGVRWLMAHEHRWWRHRRRYVRSGQPSCRVGMNGNASRIAARSAVHR